jgi:putative protease
LPFSVYKLNNNDDYVLSLKDLSLKNQHEKLIKTGVSSLKIEGRMKSPQYVFASVKRLFNALNGIKEDIPETFLRSGFTDGYFTGQKNAMFGFRTKEDVSDSAESEKIISDIMHNTARKIKTDFYAEIKINTPSKLTLKTADITVTAEGDTPQKAQKRPLKPAEIEKQLTKTGQTPFECGSFRIDCDNDLFMPMSALNELRRKACDELSKALCDNNTPKFSAREITVKIPDKAKQCEYETAPSLRVSVETLEGFEAALLSGVTEIIIPVSLAPKIPPEKRQYAFLFMPRFGEFSENLDYLKSLGYNHAVITNIGQITKLKNSGFQLHGAFGLNVSNSLSAKFFAEYLEDFTASIECKAHQIPRIRGIKTNIVAYGKIPLMLTLNCPIKNAVGCTDCTKSITDRTGRSFDVVCTNSYTEIFNADTLDISGKLENFNTDIITLMFKDESIEEIKDIISCFKNNSSLDRQNITRGLYFRGVTDV